MIYDFKNEHDITKAKDYLNKCFEKGSIVEIKRKVKKNTYAQNRYCHLIMGAFGLNFGLTLEEVKQDVFKKLVNYEIFYEHEYEGVVNISIFRSFRDINDQEMTIAISKFHKFSAEHGYALPESEDLIWLNKISNEIEEVENKKYL